MESRYDQEPVGGGRVRFTVTPAPVPRARGAPIGIAAIFVLIVYASTPAHVGTIPLLIRAVVAGVGAWWVHGWTSRWLAGRVDRMRFPGGTFIASPSGIVAGEGHIGREQLHRLIVRNGIPTGAEPAAASAMSSDHGAWSRGGDSPRAASVSYMLCAESDGIFRTLAGGMTEETAQGLLAEVSRVLRLS